MALPPELLEIAGSLTIDEIPPKLRCASCNLLAIDAFRMPCCDQIVCEKCQQNLDQTCPICLHEPVNAEDCKPNKALRTTVKVWLKKRGTEREAALRRELASKAPATPTTPATPTVPNAPNHYSAEAPTLPDTNPGEEHPQPTAASEASSSSGAALKLEEQHALAEAQKDIPQPSIEGGDKTTETAEGLEPNAPTGQGQETNQNLSQQKLEEQEAQQKQQKQLYDQWIAMNGAAPGMNNGAYGFDGVNGGFPSMGINSTTDFSQMMQYMPNGMPHNPMGVFPNMMPMPGMVFDPMTMTQGMYGGYNGQSMGMNGMNGGMGFANGQGAYGGYNGQSASWNAGQNNYNQNAYGGHANGINAEFGSNSGYGGYNMPQHQGNFNQVHPRQFSNHDSQYGYHGQGFQGRGRGRGRGYQNGGRGRGGYNQVDESSAEKQQSSEQSQYNEKTQPPAENGMSPTGDTDGHKVADDFDMAKEFLPGDAEDHVDLPADHANAEEEVAPAKASVEDLQKPETHEELETDSTDPKPSEGPPKEAEEPPQALPIETYVPSERSSQESSSPITSVVPAPSTAMLPPPSPAIPTGPAALVAPDQPSGFEFGIRGRGRGYHRGSYDHRGGSRGRGSNYLTNGHPPHVANSQAPPAPPVAPVEPKGLGVEGAPTGPKALREGLPNTGIRGGRGFAIVGRASAAAHARSNGHARSKSPSPTRSRSRSRSRSPHRSHRHRSYRHRSVDSSHSNARDEDRERHHRRSRKHADEDYDDEEGTTKRSSYRHRDDDRDKESARPSHRSHRSHRDRSREREGEHRSSRRRSRSPEASIDQARQANGAIPTSPKGHKRKERDEEAALSSRKRRERDEEDYQRARKRSKTDPSESLGDADERQRSKRSHRDENGKSRDDKSQRTQSRTTHEEETKAPQPQMDAHTREREARNKERMQKELQRRQKQMDETTEIKVVGAKRRSSKLVDGRVNGIGGSRRVSYKYEDESNEARVESEREASRWG